MVNGLHQQKGNVGNVAKTILQLKELDAALQKPQYQIHLPQVTFRCLTSLSTNVDNAHLPSFYKKCYQSFSNALELNKHADSQ